MHHSLEKKSADKERNISALTSFRVKPLIFTLLAQVMSVRKILDSGTLQYDQKLKLHAEFVSLSLCTQAITNSAIEALSIFDNKSAAGLAQGLGEIESLTKKVGLIEQSTYWEDTLLEYKEQQLERWSMELFESYHKIERATSFAGALMSAEQEMGLSEK